MTGERQLNLLKGPRQKGEVLPDPLEMRTHIALADALAWGLADGWWCSHIPSGEHRSAATGALLKRMGTKRGMADFLLLGPSKVCFLELKRRGNKLTPEQKAFQQAALNAGAFSAVAYGFDEAEEMLKKWGAVRDGIHVSA